jgi:hypothetical protein
MDPADRSILLRGLENTHPQEEPVGPVRPEAGPKPAPTCQVPNPKGEIIGPLPVCGPPAGPKPAPKLTSNCQTPNPKGEPIGPLPTCGSLVSKTLDDAGIDGRYPALKRMLVEDKDKAALEKIIGGAQWSPSTKDDHAKK